MAEITLRGRIANDDRVELLDPLPADFDRAQEVRVILSQATIYAMINEYGDQVIVDEQRGTVTPVNPLTADELLNSPLIGLWADRRDEISDSAVWVHKLRREESEESDLWRGRKLF